jgi:pyrimidine-nucleoside phosphorylase
MLRTRQNPALFIKVKRDGGVHSEAQINAFIRDYMAGQVTDYQMSAWLMAALLRGLDDAETTALTQAMLHSGKVLKLASVRAPKIDKHSTGGVGDKISICLGPLVAACGVAVPMISGRGLGHTGGTLDKLEAIRGYRVALDARTFERVVREVGVSMIGQTAELAPADRMMYALRDVTGTVESVPLIVASILSKKLAEGIDGLVFDVKAGRGAFMKDARSARVLARALVRTAARAGKRVTALITDMSVPIGRSVGNALETREAIAVLENEGPSDTRELTVALGVEMLLLGRVVTTRVQAKQKLERALADGSALERFERMLKAHGGDVKVVKDPSRLGSARERLPLFSLRSGYVADCDAHALGLSALALGAGRMQSGDPVDHTAGIELAKVVGERVEKGEPLAFVHAASKALARSELARVRAAFSIQSTRPRPKKRVIERLIP